MKRLLQRAGELPFVMPVATLVLLLWYVAEVALAIAWLLRCLEIPSIFDRWVPGSAWFLLLLFALVVAAQGLWATLVNAMEGDLSLLGSRARASGTREPIPHAAPTKVPRQEGDGNPAQPATKWGSQPRHQP